MAGVSPFGFGVSPSDLVTFIHIMHDLYHKYKKGPQQIQDMLTSLRDLEQQMDSLNNILQVANVSNCPQYDGFEILKVDLIEAQTFLARFPRLSLDSNKVPKWIDAAKFKWKGADVNDWRQKLADHRARIESYKTLIIIYALYQNHQTVFGQDRNHELPDSVADENKVLEKAYQIIQRRKIESSPISFQSMGSTLVDQQYDMQKTFQEIVADAEVLNLHLRDNAVNNNPEAWTEIIDKLRGLVARKISISSNASPELNNGRLFQSHLRSPSGSIQNTNRIVDLVPGLPVETNGTEEPISSGPRRTSVLLPEPAVNSFVGLETIERHTIPLSGTIQVSCGLLSKLFGAEWVDVQLEISRTASSTDLWAVATQQRPRSYQAGDTKSGVTPRQVLAGSPSSAGANPIETPIILKHTIYNSIASYPAIHFPGVKNCDIVFYSRQWVELEGTFVAAEQFEIRYRLSSASDRDVLRAYIFGSKLVASAGYDSISPERVCDLQALTLWMNPASEELRPSNTYISLPYNTIKGRTNPNSIKMFKVLACQNLSAARRVNGTHLVLKVEPVSVSDFQPGGANRQGSVSTNSTRISFSSSYRRTSQVGSLKTAKPCTLKILLSDRNEDLRRDKRRLLEILEQQFAPG